MNINHIAELAGVDVETAEEWIGYDWPNASEHQAWLETASDEEIAGWIKAGQ